MLIGYNDRHQQAKLNWRANMYDATREYAPFERKENPSGRHPRPRIGATQKKRERELKRRMAAGDSQQQQKSAPQKGNGKKK